MLQVMYIVSKVNNMQIIFLVVEPSNNKILNIILMLL